MYRIICVESVEIRETKERKEKPMTLVSNLIKVINQWTIKSALF